MSFAAWCSKHCDISPTFQCWSLVLELELMIFTIVRSLRESKFNLYIEVLKQITPWFFALDKTTYARWIPVHIRDAEPPMQDGYQST